MMRKLEQTTNPYSENILILYIDALSRANSIRNLKNNFINKNDFLIMIKFFEKFMPYKGGHNEKYPNENFHSFQFFKYIKD